MKIVSLLPSATEIVCALGLADSLVGVTHECDFPAGMDAKPVVTASRISHETMSSREIDHAVRSQLDGHGTIYDLDTDLLAELKPDLIITQELCDVCAVNYKTVNQAVRTYTADSQVISLEPNTMEDIFDTILTIGGLTDTAEKADEVVSNLANRAGDVWHHMEFIERTPRVMMLEWLDPPFAPGHWVPEQVETAGGTCLLGFAGERSVTTTYDTIADADPEVLVLIPCGYYVADTLRQLEQTVFPARWRDMTAVRNDNIWAMDATSYFSRPGPRIVDGIEKLAKVIHPDRCGTPTDADAVRVHRSLLRFES